MGAKPYLCPAAAATQNDHCLERKPPGFAAPERMNRQVAKNQKDWGPWRLGGSFPRDAFNP
ncbi:MAG TPA: hypothetical protein VLJ38_01575, partial [Polyangiaceae bacterium]|nr:hypothetical protein [Polyangiaceae bacterium]